MVNLILSNVVLSPLTVTVNPDLEPLSLSILWPKMSVNSTKSQLYKQNVYDTGIALYDNSVARLKESIKLPTGSALHNN